MQTIILDPQSQWLARVLRNLFPECRIAVRQESLDDNIDLEIGDPYDRSSGNGRGAPNRSRRRER